MKQEEILNGSIRNYYTTYLNEIAKIDRQIAGESVDLVAYPEKEKRRYLDAERGIT